MNDRTAMMKAICMSPQDDTPRLIFADWLEEHGEPERAELIRVQCELAPWEKCDSSHEPLHLPELRRREREFLANGGNWSDWPSIGWCENLPHLRHIAPIDSPRFTFSRGFIGSASMSWSDWLRHAPALHWHPEERDPQYTYDPSSGEDRVTRHVPRPFPATAQPIEEVRLTDWPCHSPNYVTDAFFATIGGVDARFARQRCPTCDGRPREGPMPRLGGWPCPDCHGTPPNVWTCDRWRGVRFVMPEAEPGRIDNRMTDEQRYHYGDVPLGTRRGR